MKATTQLSVLLFDPDPDGRQLIHSVFQREAPEVRLTLRARQDSFLRSFSQTEFDAVVLGLPPHDDKMSALFQVLLQSQKMFPMLFLVAPGISLGVEGGHHWYAKNKDSLAVLAKRLPSLVRAARIRALTLDLGTNPRQAGSSTMRTQVANKAVIALADLGLLSMYFSIDPRSGQWVIRASSYTDELTATIESLVAKGGRVAPLLDTVPLSFKRLLQGAMEMFTLDLEDLLRILMPWLSLRDVRGLRRALGLETVSLAPVRHQEDMHGMLAVGGPLSDEEQSAVLHFVPHLAHSLSYAKETDERNARAQGLQTLQQILVSVSSTMRSEQLVENVLDLLAGIVDYNSARVYVREDEQLELKAVRGERGVAPHTKWQIEKLRESGSGFWETLHMGSANIFSEINDKTKVGEPDTKTEWRSWLAVPIQWHSQINGILTLSSRLQGYFQPLHLEIVETVAQQLGVALENARLLEHSLQRAEKLKIVHEIGRSSVSLLDSQLLVFEAAQRVIQIFGYDQVGIFMVDEDVLIPEIFLYGKDLKERKGIGNIILNSGTIIDEAVRANIPIVSSEVHGEAGITSIAGTKKAREAMVIPISIKGAVVGVLLVLSHKEDGIDEDDVEILQVLAAQLGISLVNARLFSEVRAHAAKLEQRVAERTDELQSQKERTEAILRSVADAVMVLDLEGRLVLANPTAQSLLGRVWSDQLYQHVVELQQDENHEQASWEFGSESFEALASNVDLDGQVIGTVVVLRNITRLKELDRLKTQFVATVSHELRTPLANIKLYLSLLRRRNVDRESHYFQTLDRETERLTTMIEDLLDLSRLDAEKQVAFHPLELGDLMLEIIEAQRPVCANKRLTLRYKADGHMQIVGNRDRLIQVFTNLIANAIAYTPAGGSIAVQVKSTERVDDKVGVIIEVEDTGMGIPADELPYVFDRFYRGRMAQQLKIHGSGLGLAIVREIVESHGGNISVRSGIGKGTCFRIWLPLAEGGEEHHG